MWRGALGRRGPRRCDERARAGRAGGDDLEGALAAARQQPGGRLPLGLPKRRQSGFGLVQGLRRRTWALPRWPPAGPVRVFGRWPPPGVAFVPRAVGCTPATSARWQRAGAPGLRATRSPRTPSSAGRRAAPRRWRRILAVRGSNASSARFCETGAKGGRPSLVSTRLLPWKGKPGELALHDQRGEFPGRILHPVAARRRVDVVQFQPKVLDVRSTHQLHCAGCVDAHVARRPRRQADPRRAAPAEGGRRSCPRRAPRCRPSVQGRIPPGH